MNPLRLHARGYRSFDELDLEIPDGCTAVVGPNGAGKSSILNVVDVALFAERGELADLLSTDHDQLELGLEFEHDGETYRVRRQYRKGKATLDFERLIAEDLYPAGSLVEVDLGTMMARAGWEPLTRETAAATQQLICETIGLSRTTFRASAFLRQDDSAAFTEAQPRDRKQILAEILQLERWEHRRDQAAQAARVHETELAKLEGRAELAVLTANLRGETERALENLSMKETAELLIVTGRELAVEEAQTRLVATQAAKERVRACQAELAAATADERRARDLLLEAQQAKAAADGMQAELVKAAILAETIPALEERLAVGRAVRDEAAAADKTRSDLLTAAAAHRDNSTRTRLEGDQLSQHHTLLASRLVDLQHAEDETARCDRCEQLLGGEAKQTAIVSLQRELDALEQRISDKVNAAIGEERLARETADQAANIFVSVVPDLPRLEADLARARDGRARKDGLEQLLAGHREKTVKLPLLETELMQLTAVTAAKQTALDKATAAAGDTTGLEQQLAVLRADLTRARVALEETRRLIAIQEAQLARVAEAEAELAEISGRRGVLRAEVDTLKIAERAFGRDGIPALLVEAVAVPQLEAEANRILQELGTPFLIELRTQAENKSNANVRETLDILVFDGSYERDYATYSGGERARLNLALRLALAQLLAHRRGAESRILCIDELDGLDQAGMERLVAVLERLTGTFARILIVSHQADLANAFEQTITVEKTNDRSRIISAAVGLQAVPA